MRTLFLSAVVWVLLGHISQGQDSLWAQWEPGFQRLGPERAKGLIVYFHGSTPVASLTNASELPALKLFAEVAGQAQWDILRINRAPAIDIQPHDDEIVRFAGQQVAKARQDGYRHIYVGGTSRGGWLALSAAKLPDVDGVVGLAPGTTNLSQRDLESQTQELARILSQAVAPHVAAVPWLPGAPMSQHLGASRA